MNTKITQLFGIEHPVIQGGMVWCSGWKLASAVSNAGGLGLLGAGSMYPEVLREHIQKCQAATDKPFGVNVPLLYPDIEKIIDIIIEEGVKVVFTSAGSPKKWTQKLQSNGIKVAHVVSSAFFAKKCEDAGVDAVVAEGFEAGGHNGREETTTMALIPNVARSISVPLIAAGGLSTGASFAAALALGADGIQIGSRFAISAESSAHDLFKNKVVESKEGDTMLALKKLAPARLIKNKFYDDLVSLEETCPSIDEVKALLGRGRAKKGMFEGDLDEGELEIGQVASMIDSVETVEDIFKELLTGYDKALNRLKSF